MRGRATSQATSDSHPAPWWVVFRALETLTVRPDTIWRHCGDIPVHYQKEKCYE